MNKWETKSLGEVCEVLNGGTPKTGVPKYWDGENLWITPAEMGKRLSPYVSNTERKITDLGLSDSSARMLSPNSVILSSRAPIGHLVINTEPMATNQGCKGLIPCSQLDHKFLYYYLSSIVDLLNALGTGATFKELSGGKLKEVPIPIPSLPEQQRIVSILDEAFESIAAAKANADKNLQNSQAIFESYHHFVFSRGSKEWDEKPLGEVCEYVNGKAHEQCIDKDGQYIVINSKFIATEGEIVKRSNEALLLLQPDDIAMVLSDVPNGKALAKCFLVEKASTYTLNQRICLIRSSRFHSKFLFHQLNRNLHFMSFDNGENQTNLRLNQVLSCPLYLPSLSDQNAVAANLDAVLDQSLNLESIYQQKLDALEALKKSLLHQAFTGEL